MIWHFKPLSLIPAFVLISMICYGEPMILWAKTGLLILSVAASAYIGGYFHGEDATREAQQ